MLPDQHGKNRFASFCGVYFKEIIFLCFLIQLSARFEIEQHAMCIHVVRINVVMVSPCNGL